MDIESQIAAWTEMFLEGDLFLVGVEHKTGSRKLAIYIDGEAGVSIEDCRKLSRYLSEKLDELDYGSEAYHLEVSSPGADRPLKSPRQYGKHIGRELKVIMKARTELVGKLDSIDEQGITLLLKDKKKLYKEPVQKEIPFGDIEESIVQISFK